jgi:hypothetical protein
MHNTGVRQVSRMLLTAGLIAVLYAAPAAQVAPPALPSAVDKAFRTSYPGATISSVAQEREGRRTLLRVESTDKGRRRMVVYDEQGSVVETAEAVSEKELPKPVADAMYSHRRAIYVSGLKVTRGRNVEYRLTLRGTRKTALVAKPDGTVVSFK